MTTKDTQKRRPSLLPKRPSGIPLCQTCIYIPYRELLNPSSASSRKVYSVDLSTILRENSKCAFCKLLLDASCLVENDLFKSDHIMKPLANDEKFANRKTFANWVQERHRMVSRIVHGEDPRENYWPFGYTHDVNEEDAVKDAAEKLFRKAELSDVAEVSLQSEIDGSTSFDLEEPTALQAASLATGLAGVAGPNRLFAGAQTVTSQLAILEGKKPKKLPCWYILQLYGPSEDKASAISVRVYAHSRAARSPLEEISHFSLRMSKEIDLTRPGQQLWYGRALETRTDFNFFRACLIKCHDSHRGLCDARSENPRTVASSEGTFRLIDTSTMSLVEYTCSSPGDHNVNDYVALSYVWGDPPLPASWEEFATAHDYDPPSAPDFYYQSRHDSKKKSFQHPMTRKEVCDLRLTNRTLPTLTKEGGLKERYVEIPLTVRDAIDVVKRLGLRYLWCDRLCIVQEPGEDRDHNLAWMGQVYSEALLTIVAADSKNAAAGIQGVNTNRNVNSQLPPVGPTKIVPGIELFLPVSMKREYHPWAGRAWTFQEQFLSRRLLVFSNGNAIWHCRAAVLREDVNAKDLDIASTELELLSMAKITSTPKSTQSCPGLLSIHPDGSSRIFRTPSFGDYIKMIDNFSRRRVTKSSDIMNSFRGISAVFAKAMGCELLYGIPLAYTDLALLWRPRKLLRRRESTEDAPAPPSWSPLGWECHDKEHERAGVYFEPLFDVLANEVGVYTRLKRESEERAGEERMRPRRHSMYHVTPVGTTYDLTDIGMLASSRNEEGPPGSPGPRTDLTPLLSQVGEYQLILRTRVARVSLVAPMTIKSTYWTEGIETYRRQDWEMSPSSELESEKDVQRTSAYLIADPSNSKTGVGFVTMTLKVKLQCPQFVEAMILSQAQYMGNEIRIEDLGYYLYNIMIIQRVSGGAAERIGLGKIWKTAWNRASPRDEVIILQ